VSLGVCCASPARADYQANKYVEPGTNQVLEYNLFVPGNIVSGAKYPLLVYLHAASDKNPPNRTLSSDGKGWVPQMMTADGGKTTAFYMIPISQTNASGWGDPLGPITDTEKFEGRLTVVVVKQLLSKYPIDADRLYVTGASMGARGTYDLLRRYPDLFAAGAPAAAPARPDDAAIYATQNIWSVMGANDPVAQPNRDTVAAIRKACGNPIYTELAGHGHDSWRSIYPMPEFIAWMFAQRRGVPWAKISTAPTEAQVKAHEASPVNGLTPSQPIVVSPTCSPAGNGGTGGSAGATDSGGAASGGVASGGVAGTEATSVAGQPGLTGRGGLSAGGTTESANAAAGSVAASVGGGVGVAGSSNAGASALPGTLGSAGSNATEANPADDPASGCTVVGVGALSVRRSATDALPLLATLGILGFRRRRSATRTRSRHLRRASN
jgi:hypothetical protein